MDVLKHEGMPKNVRLLSLAGGLIQVVVASGLLFLPVFATCYGDSCVRQSYIQLGGSLMGTALLALMLATGLLVVAGNFQQDHVRQRQMIWFAAISSFVTAVIGAWSIGFAFLPGGILLVSAAIFGRRQPAIR